MKAKQEPLGVTRFNYPETHRLGWMARISRNGERRSEFFADNDLGGSRAAKAAALKQHRRWLGELGPAQTSHKGKKTRRNRSGHVNIYSRRHFPKDKPHLEYYFTVGTWTLSNSRKRNKSFSWNRYTEAGALKLAIIARDLCTQDMEQIRAEYRRRHGRNAPDYSEQ